VWPFRSRWHLDPPNTTPGWHEQDEWRHWEPPRNLIRGESHYLPVLQKLSGGGPCKHGYLIAVDVDLTREPANRYDRNALRAEIRGELVGHLRREVAAQLSPMLDKARVKHLRVCGIIRGGSKSAPNVGVHLWLDRHTTPGAAVTFADDMWAVDWPPHKHEGEAEE
jgi:HIRAN domain